MSIRDAFLVRAPRAFCASILFLASVICLNAPAAAVPGGGHGGGGHGGFGGGHFGGGHFGHAHTARSGNSGGHRHWMKLGLGKKKSAVTTADASGTRSSWWNFNSASPSAASRPMPSTMLWSATRLESGVPFISVSSESAHHFQNGHFQGHRPFASSGCSFNGMTQICFFEPFLPLLGVGYFGYGGGYVADWDNSGDLSGMHEEEMTGVTQPVSPEENPPSANENSAAWDAAARAGANEDWDLGKGVFVLVLRNGATHPVTNYWAAEGYLEYVSPDGTRSHVPLDALDLESTVVRNEARGLPFVLRATAERQ